MKAELNLSYPEPQVALDRLCGEFAEHGRVRRGGARGARIALSYGRFTLLASGKRLRLRAHADDPTNLAFVKMSVVRHLRDLAGGTDLGIRWTGDGTAAGARPPFFREMRVAEAFDVTPAMRRVVLSGADLDRFATGGHHVRLVFPASGRAPQWPVMGEDGCPVWPDGEHQATARVYTIRRIDPARGEVSLDILRHDGDATPGSFFAANAKPGDPVGMAGPLGGGVPDADRLFLFGDETAIPAIDRILAVLPAGARAEAVIEVAGPQEEQPLRSAAAHGVRWLHRGEGSGTLADAARDLTREALGEKGYVWAGCEFADFAAIRRHCRKVLGLARERHHVVAYWRKTAAAS